MSLYMSLYMSLLNSFFLKTNVRINSALPRHRSFLRTLYVCRECIVVEGVIPKQAPIKRKSSCKG